MSQSDSFSEAELRETIERVLSSVTFRSAASLRTLLTYLSDRALRGETENLKEYTVGVEAFNKPSDYSPQLDASVRVLAGNLRQKLHEYYRKEGTADSIRIEFPKGHFSLRFRAASAARSPSSDSARVNRVLVLVAGAFALLAAYLGVELREERRASPPAGVWNPALEGLWRPILESSRTTVIAFNTPLFFRISHFYIRDTWINDWEPLSESPFLRFLQGHLDDPAAEPSQAHVGVGEVNGVFLLSRLLSPRGRGLVVRRGLSLAWEDVVNNNVIFLGDPKFNPKLKALPLEQHFVIEKDTIRNLYPGPLEQSEYRKLKGEDSTRSVEGYALVSRLSFEGHGHGHIFVLASNSTQGTWAAAHVMTDPLLAHRLTQRLRDSSGKLPPSFQVLLRAQFRAGVPTDITYVTHRLLTSSAELCDQADVS